MSGTACPKPVPRQKPERVGLVRKTPLVPSGWSRRQPTKMEAAGQEKGRPILSSLRRSQKPIPKWSTKRRKEQAERDRVLRALFPAHEWHGCSVPGCGAEANDAHEKRSRGRGGSASDASNIAALCRLHHDASHAEDPALYAAGLMKHSWETNQRGEAS